MTQIDDKTVSLALGSGGARGLAHIGVIRSLSQNGFQIRSVAGSSMGALVGGLYAAGQLDTFEHWVTALDRIDVWRLLDLSFGGAALFKGERIIDTLRDLVGAFLIEQLPVTYTAVATDVERQKEVWLTKGPLFDAIRASIAIPTVFTPHEIDGRRLLDGGLVNPLPIAPTLTDTTALTVAVNLSARYDRRAEPAPPDPTTAGAVAADYRRLVKSFISDLQGGDRTRQPPDWNFRDVMSMSFDTMQNTMMRMKLAAYSPDITVEIPRNAAAMFDFHRAPELIELGRRQTELALASRRVPPATDSGS